MRLPPRIPGAQGGDAAPLPAWPPVLATRGPGSASSAHAHHAMHLLLSHGRAVRVEIEGERRDVPGVLTAPDARHAIDASGADVTLVFLDPESDAGDRLRATLDGPARFLTTKERDRLVQGDDAARAGGPDDASWADRIVRALGAASMPRRRVHPRVRALLRHLRDLPPSADTSLEALALEVGLSPGRLMHVFTESIGIPLRPYLGWLRLQRAAAAVLSGVPLSRAAATAGFVDAAHMTRAFRGMFGTTPSALREIAASRYKPEPAKRRKLGA